MKLPPLKIRNLVSEFPVIQAGMGVRIGNATLAAAAVNCGAFGTIASVGMGDIATKKEDFARVTGESLVAEIRHAKELCNHKKPLGINVMVALSNYESMIRYAISEGVDFIISGAGLPLYLPEYVGDADVALIPVISGGRAMEVILKTWARRYNRKPDAVIVEGPKNGGHLGFTMEQIEHPETCSLEILCKEVREVLNAHGCDSVPMLAAGEVASKADIERCLAMGYDGVQIGTYFIAAEESGIDRRSKEVFVKATTEDIVVTKSPVGLPVRVLKTPLVQRVLAGNREPFTCPYRCLRTCNPAKSMFCIARALLATWSGDVEHGLYMCGMNVKAVDHIYPLKEFFDSLR